MVAVENVRAVLDDLLHADRFLALDDPHGLWLPGPRDIHAIGVALDPWPDLPAWVVAECLHALVLHRPWDVPAPDLPGAAVFGYHLAFDEALTTGMNPWLADAIGMRDLEPLGEKQGRPLGMIGSIQETTVAAAADRFAAEFGHSHEVVGNLDAPVGRIAVVGAMWPELVREAVHRGADLYVTGTFRPRAQSAVDETGVAVLVVGHDPPERWGMRTLARLVANRLPSVRIALAPDILALAPE